MIEILIGFISGIISGMGMGGGTILILLLSIFKDMNQHTAQATNLVFFIPTAIAATIVGIKNKNVNLKLAFGIIPFGIIGAIAGATLCTHLDVYWLRKFFGIFLLVISFYEIYSWYRMYIKQIFRHTKNRNEKTDIS